MMNSEEDLTIRSFKISRNLPLGTYKFRDVFSGYEVSPTMQELFMNPPSIFELQNLDVEVTADAKYMRVSDVDGRLLISPNYLRRGRKEFLYLDLIHELTHVRQFHQGHNIYDPKFRYIDRPTEIEAFTNAVAEARRIKLSNLEIYEYIRVDWISDSELEELAERLGVPSPVKRDQLRKRI